jgi:hypothetical protein
MNSQLHALADLALGKEPPIPMRQEIKWALVQVRMLWRKAISPGTVVYLFLFFTPMQIYTKVFT